MCTSLVFSILSAILNTTLMSSNIITYMLLNQLSSHALVLTLYD